MAKKCKFWNEFKEFAMKGNVIDMAVGIVIGGAFGKIVTSLVNDLSVPSSEDSISRTSRLLSARLSWKARK